MKGHGVAMMSALAFYELGEITGEPEILAAADYFCEQIIREFVRPELKGLVEYITLDGRFVDTPEGRTMVPGHGIESMWFLLDIYRRSGRRKNIPAVLQTMEWCLLRGWDDKHGGLLLGIDILDKTPVYWKHGMYKLWWPVTEALAATLLAYEFDASPKWLEWHRRIMDWSLPRYPVPEHGEWRQRLTREGNPYDPFLVLPVKDPFHLPRGLIVGIEAIDRLKAKADPVFV
jgi:N-acylglucosamine 2-epimerase